VSGQGAAISGRGDPADTRQPAPARAGPDHFMSKEPFCCCLSWQSGAGWPRPAGA